MKTVSSFLSIGSIFLTASLSLLPTSSCFTMTMDPAMHASTGAFAMRRRRSDPAISSTRLSSSVTDDLRYRNSHYDDDNNNGLVKKNHPFATKARTSILAPTAAMTTAIESTISAAANEMPSFSSTSFGKTIHLDEQHVRMLNPLELPMKHSSNGENTTIMSQTELIIGRIAMIAAVLFFLVEVTTGQSLPVQLSSLSMLLQ